MGLFDWVRGETDSSRSIDGVCGTVIESGRSVALVRGTVVYLPQILGDDLAFGYVEGDFAYEPVFGKEPRLIGKVEYFE